MNERGTMTEGNFYIFLSSRDCLRYHPDNTAYNFTVELPERVELKGNWKVSLSDILLNEKISNTLMVCDHGNRGRFKRLGYYICFLSARVFKLLVGVTVFSVKTAGISVVIWSVMVNNC